MELDACVLHLPHRMQTEHISVLCTAGFSLATGTSALGSYYHPNFTDSETESLSDFPTIAPSSICSKAVLETFHTLCSIPALFLGPIFTSAFTISAFTQPCSCSACLWFYSSLRRPAKRHCHFTAYARSLVWIIFPYNSSSACGVLLLNDALKNKQNPYPCSVYTLPSLLSAIWI